MKHWIWLMLLLGIGLPAQAEVRGEVVEYRLGDTVMKGYIAYDDAIKGKRPGVLVVHEWWGHNEYARKRARQLAQMGYTALAVDMYGDGKQAAHPDDATRFMNEVNNNLAIKKARFLMAKQLLERHRTVNSNHLAAIGYCFGGGVVLEMARQGVDLDGVASFHGSLGTHHPARPGKIKADILVLNGADDPMAPPTQVEQFRKEMEAAGADFRIVNYAGAKHSFTNPEADAYGKKFNMPLAYSADADQRSWAELQAFLKRVFSR